MRKHESFHKQRLVHWKCFYHSISYLTGWLIVSNMFFITHPTVNVSFQLTSYTYMITSGLINKRYSDYRSIHCSMDICVCTKSECESINVSFRSSRHYLMSAAVWWFPHCETQRQASPMRYFQLVGWYTPEALQWLMQSVRAVPWPVGYITGCQQVTLTDGFLSSNVF